MGFKNQESNLGVIEKVNDVPAAGVDAVNLGSKQCNTKLNGQAGLKLGVRKVGVGRGGHASSEPNFNVGKNKQGRRMGQIFLIPVIIRWCGSKKIKIPILLLVVQVASRMGWDLKI